MVRCNAHQKPPTQIAEASAQIFVALGVNTGMPFEVTVGWRTEVPQIGLFVTDFQTNSHCADLKLRISLAERLLIPGAGRWRCIADHLIMPEHFDLVEDFEAEWRDATVFDVANDGQLVVRLANDAIMRRRGEL